MEDQEPISGEESSADVTPKKKTVRRPRARTPKATTATKAKSAKSDDTAAAPTESAEKSAAPKEASKANELPLEFEEKSKDKAKTKSKAKPKSAAAAADKDDPARAEAAQPDDGPEPSSQSGSRSGEGRGGERQEDRWQNNRGKKGGRNQKKGKWKKRDPRDRPPAQPLPPGMEEVKVGELPDPALFEDLAVLDAEALAAHKSSADPLHLNELYPLGIAELGAKGESLGATIEGVPARRSWLEAIFRTAAEHAIPLHDHGWLDMTDDGYGFVVHPHVAYRLYPENSYVPASARP